MSRALSSCRDVADIRVRAQPTGRDRLSAEQLLEIIKSPQGKREKRRSKDDVYPAEVEGRWFVKRSRRLRLCYLRQHR